MEWNKVKSMLIALLLVVNLLLALNIQTLISSQRANEQESLGLALSLLEKAGAQFDSQQFWDMPRSTAVLLGERSTEREAQIAGALHWPPWNGDADGSQREQGCHQYPGYPGEGADGGGKQPVRAEGF